MNKSASVKTGVAMTFIPGLEDVMLGDKCHIHFVAHLTQRQGNSHL